MRIIQRGGIEQLLHHRRKAAQIAHIQKFAGFETNVLLPLSHGLQNGQHLRHGLVFLQQGKYQPAAAHVEGRARLQPARLDLFKGGGGVDLAQFAQFAHALCTEGENIARTAQHNSSSANHKACIGEEIQKLTFGTAVAQEQPAILQRGGSGRRLPRFLLIRLIERIQHRVAIVEFHARLHIAADQIQIDHGLEGRGNQPCAQFRRRSDRAYGGQRGQQRGQRLLRLAGRIAEARALRAQQATHARLRAVQMHHLALPQHIARIRRDQTQRFHALGLNAQFRGRKRNRKTQRQFHRADAALRLFLIPDHEHKGMRFKIAQRTVQKRSAHHDKSSVGGGTAVAILVAGRAVLPGAQRIGPERNMIHQQCKQALILAGKTHDRRTIGKFF